MLTLFVEAPVERMDSLAVYQAGVGDCAIRVAPYLNDCLNTPLIAILKVMYAVDSSENVALVSVPEQRQILVSAHFPPAMCRSTCSHERDWLGVGGEGGVQATQANPAPIQLSTEHHTAHSSRKCSLNSQPSATSRVQNSTKTSKN
jgi:hypothetical protein